MSRWTVLLFAIAALSQAASACSIPVFRYALEQWQPDPFMVAVFYQGELTVEQQALLEKLEAVNENGTPVANVMVKAIDVEAETNPGLLRLWELQETDTLPWMAVHAPARSGPPQRIISGELRADLIDRLLQSSARDQVAQRLVEGDSVVWVFLESGNGVVDDDTFSMVQAELARLQTTLRLPEIEAADFGDLSIVPEALRLAFTAIRVSRDDPHESAFVRMLLHVDDRLSDENPPREPMAFPLFGRGRVLYSLSGERLDRQSIEDACRFLTGACQCTVKAQNPGVDLLMSVDWDSRIQSVLPLDESPPTLVGLGGFTSSSAAGEAEVAASEADSTNQTFIPAATEDATTVEEPSSPDGERPSLGPESDLAAAASKPRDVSVDNSPAHSFLLTLSILGGLIAIATGVLMIRSK